jgi:hypothetical protein
MLRHGRHGPARGHQGGVSCTSVRIQRANGPTMSRGRPRRLGAATRHALTSRGPAAIASSAAASRRGCRKTLGGVESSNRGSDRAGQRDSVGAYPSGAARGRAPTVVEIHRETTTVRPFPTASGKRGSARRALRAAPPRRMEQRVGETCSGAAAHASRASRPVDRGDDAECGCRYPATRRCRLRLVAGGNVAAVRWSRWAMASRRCALG